MGTSGDEIGEMISKSVYIRFLTFPFALSLDCRANVLRASKSLYLSSRSTFAEEYKGVSRHLMSLKSLAKCISTSLSFNRIRCSRRMIASPNLSVNSVAFLNSVLVNF